MGRPSAPSHGPAQPSDNKKRSASGFRHERGHRNSYDAVRKLVPKSDVPVIIDVDVVEPQRSERGAEQQLADTDDSVFYRIAAGKDSPSPVDARPAKKGQRSLLIYRDH